MNITHAVHEEVSGDRLKAIFDRQRELMSKYHDIELRSGLMQTEDCPVNLNDKRGQARIKDFAWRTMEEVGEALDAREHGNVEHFCEELIDGLHFLTELTILSGNDYNDIIESKDGIDSITYFCNTFYKSNMYENLNELVTKFVMNIGMMCNCLKNKPWKQTNMITDVKSFRKWLKSTWYIYISLLLYEMEEDDIVDVYLKKSQVNKFRQRSNY